MIFGSSDVIGRPQCRLKKADRAGSNVLFEEGKKTISTENLFHCLKFSEGMELQGHTQQRHTERVLCYMTKGQSNRPGIYGNG